MGAAILTEYFMYIVKAHRRHGRYEYFMGFNSTGIPIITTTIKNAKPCSESEANKVIELLSGPYTKYEKEEIKTI